MKKPAFTFNCERLAKRAEDYPAIFGSVNLTSIRENVLEILKLIGRDGIFREYTLHDSNHIDAVLALVDRLIPKETAEKMKTADWLMIVLSCYFHDLGMVVTKKEFESRDSCPEFVVFKSELVAGDEGEDYKEALEDLDDKERDEFLYQEFVRKNHANRIFHWVQGQDAPQYGEAKAAVETINNLLSGLDNVFRSDLAQICLSHHEDDLYDFDKYKINRVYSDNPEGEANLHYVALLLRSADVLQIQKKRVPPVLYKLIDPSNPKSQEEWAKQAGVRAVKPKLAPDGSESDTVEIHASFNQEKAYFGLLAYIQRYAAKELMRCHEWAKQARHKGSVYNFPWKHIDHSQVEPYGFEGRSYSFRLDQEKILKLLTGHTLYNDYRVAVREVLQNALDAVRFRKFLNQDEPIGKIEVEWNSAAKKLTIRDTGTGMTQETIENFLLNVGSSFYQSEVVLQKHSGFSSISRFGIGVLSAFMIADEVQILTVHPDEEFARRIILPSVVKSYLIKKIPKGDATVRNIGPHGTEVMLQVRRSAELKDIEGLVRHWLILPKCKVTLKIDQADAADVGFTTAKDVLSHFYAKETEGIRYMPSSEVRQASMDGLELAYVVSKSDYADIWRFEKFSERPTRKPGDKPDNSLYRPPGLCVEGIRVRSVPAGYERIDSSPWVFANLTGSNAPRTNVARSDVEQTPELNQALCQIYSLLADHIRQEYNKLLEKHTGIVEAAREADFIRSSGLEASVLSSSPIFNEVMSQLRIVALENETSCIAVTQREIEAMDRIWTVDSRLMQDIEGVCGTLGINLPAEHIVNSLGKGITPPLPLPRLLGSSKAPISNLDVALVQIHPEERSQRIDICWEKEKPGRWVHITSLGNNIGSTRRNFSSVWVTRDSDVSENCPDYDIVIWRGWCLIFASSIIPELLDVFGDGKQFKHWLNILLRYGEIPSDSQPALKQQLSKTTNKVKDDFLPRLVLPFERRLGDSPRVSQYESDMSDD